VVAGFFVVVVWPGIGDGLWWLDRLIVAVWLCGGVWVAGLVAGRRRGSTVWVAGWPKMEGTVWVAGSPEIEGTVWVLGRRKLLLTVWVARRKLNCLVVEINM